MKCQSYLKYDNRVCKTSFLALKIRAWCLLPFPRSSFCCFTVFDRSLYCAWFCALNAFIHICTFPFSFKFIPSGCSLLLSLSQHVFTFLYVFSFSTTNAYSTVCVPDRTIEGAAYCCSYFRQRKLHHEN